LITSVRSVELGAWAATCLMAACRALDSRENRHNGIEEVVATMAQPAAADRAVTVAPQSGQAISVGRGELVRVIDVDGHQVGDMWVIDAADTGRWLSASHTRDRCERLFPAVGEQFRDQYGEPILQLATDTSPGVHDMLFPPCDPLFTKAADCPATRTAATTSWPRSHRPGSRCRSCLTR